MKNYTYENLCEIEGKNIIINNLITEVKEKNILTKLKPIKRLIEDLYNGIPVDLLCIHHYDLDGYGVYMIIRLLEKLYPALHVVYREERTKVTKKSLTMEIAHFFDYVIIGDLSFDDEFTTQELETFEVMENVALLDHHNTALNLNKYKFCNIIPHDIQNKLLWTGTSLMWIYFKDCIKDKFGYYMIQKNNQLIQLVNLIAMYDTYYWKDDKSILGDIAYKLNILFKNDNKYSFMDKLIERIVGEDKDKSFILSENDLQNAKLLEFTINKKIEYYLNRVEVASIEYGGDTIDIGYIYYNGDYASELGNRACEEKEIDVCVMIDMYDKKKLQIRSINYDCIKLFSHLKTILGDSNFGGHKFACGANNLRGNVKGFDVLDINELLQG